LSSTADGGGGGGVAATRPKAFKLSGAASDNSSGVERRRKRALQDFQDYHRKAMEKKDCCDDEACVVELGRCLALFQSFTGWGVENKGNGKKAAAATAKKPAGVRAQQFDVDILPTLDELVLACRRLGKLDAAAKYEAMRDRRRDEDCKNPSAAGKRALANAQVIFPDAAARKAIFQRYDDNRSGQLSLAEVDKAVKETWGDDADPEAIRVAFKAAAGGDGSVSPSEFKKLLKMLVIMDELYDLFDAMDDPDGDHTMTQDEWVRIGCSRLAQVLGMEPALLSPEFAAMDADGGGKIRFEEFTFFIFNRHPEVIQKLIPDFADEF
jgi:Ca2+-binding EF-hand superfamily protein